MKPTKDMKRFHQHLRRRKHYSAVGLKRNESTGVKTKQLDNVKRELMALGIDMDTGADSPRAHMLKEGIKHTGITVVNTEVIHMGTVMVPDTKRDDWESWS